MKCPRCKEKALLVSLDELKDHTVYRRYRCKNTDGCGFAFSTHESVRPKERLSEEEEKQKITDACRYMKQALNEIEEQVLTL